ncbi:tRNA dihydrouridine synthase DusB [soil metagenome]
MLARIPIGPYLTTNNVFVAPMAGVTDRPFRALCRRFGAGHAVSEMTAADPRLWGTEKTRHRTDHLGETGIRAVQIAGSDPAMLAEAARYNIERGAQVIDINMGCPAKKVCHAAAGSALLRDEPLIGRILDAVVAAATPYGVPVTLKTRTGWDRASRNATRIARIAESAGIRLLAMHGRTRCDFYDGDAEYESIRAVKAAVSIPVIVNGDIDSPAKAARVLRETGADGVMIGRAAQGRPWLLREVAHHLEHGSERAGPTVAEVREALLDHLDAHHAFYAERGVRSARKHLGWYAEGLPGAQFFWDRVHPVDSEQEQRRIVVEWLDCLAEAAGGEHATLDAGVQRTEERLAA